MFSFGLCGLTIHDSVTEETLQTLEVPSKRRPILDHYWA